MSEQAPGKESLTPVTFERIESRFKSVLEAAQTPDAQRSGMKVETRINQRFGDEVTSISNNGIILWTRYIYPNTDGSSEVTIEGWGARGLLISTKRKPDGSISGNVTFPGNAMNGNIRVRGFDELDGYDREWVFEAFGI